MQTNFDIFGVQNSQSFTMLIANGIFHVTVVLRIYFRNQFMTPESRHSRRHCSVVNNQHGIQRRGQTNFLR